MFPWDQLLEGEPGIAEQIVHRCSTRCEPYHGTNNANWPQALRPPQLVAVGLHMTEVLRIERPRSNILGHCRQDLMTVTFSGVVTRDIGDGYDFDLNYYEALAKEQGWPFDADAICRVMDYTHTWTDVSKIRLVDAGSHSGRGDFSVELVRQLFPHGEETVQLPQLFHFGSGRNMTPFIDFDTALRERLHLRRFALVGGADEYAV